MLYRAELGAAQITSGADVNVTFEWTSTAATTVYLNFDASQFSVAPTSFPLAATAAQQQEVIVHVVKITALGTARDCDVHFVQGASDQFDTVAVV